MGTLNWNSTSAHGKKRLVWINQQQQQQQKENVVLLQVALRKKKIDEFGNWAYLRLAILVVLLCIIVWLFFSFPSLFFNSCISSATTPNIQTCSNQFAIMMVSRSLVCSLRYIQRPISLFYLF